MSKLVKDNDLQKISGGRDTNKRYTFLERQHYRAKNDQDVTIQILFNYIDVPYDTQIDVTYVDQSTRRISNEKIPCWFIDENYDFMY